MNLGHQLVSALAAHGAREVFGLPGDFALPLFRAFDEARLIPLHCFLHEPAVAFAADAAARYGGGLGVALVTYGAGALNLVNAVANAYAERSPVVVVSAAPGMAERQRGLRLHHQVKSLETQRRVFEEVTCDAAVLDSLERAPMDIARVLRSALEHSRPVYLEVPRDLVASPMAAVERLAPTPWDGAAALACADEILALLGGAKRPAVLVDVEVRRFGLEGQVAELARRTGLPVATTFLGSGLLAAHPELVRGTYLGAAGDAATTALVEDADVLLGLGVIPSDTNLGVVATSLDWRHVIDASERRVRVGYHYYENIPLAGLMEALLIRTAGQPRRIAEPVARESVRDGGPRGGDGPVSPRHVIDAINDLRERVPMPVTADVGDCLFAAVDLAPGPLIASGYYATMGMAIPAALGIQARSGERAIALVGDGAFHMTGMELISAIRPGWDPIVIVFNNAGWAMLGMFDQSSPHLQLPSVDLAQLAVAMGGDGYVVRSRSELQAALARAVATRGRFQMLDVRLLPGSVSPRLDRFASALRAAPAGKVRPEGDLAPTGVGNRPG